LWTATSQAGHDAMLVGMAICRLCEREMLTAASCNVAALHIDGHEYPVVPYGKETRYGRRTANTQRCHDCGVQPGGLHHLGCDWAECPHCHGQLLSCTCPLEEFTDSDEEGAD
jgi:hypothetical protein